jgi:hypothetical protein
MQRGQEEPRIESPTSNGAFLAHQVRPLVRCKMLVEYRVEAARLVCVSIDAVLDVLRGVAVEVI